MTDHDPLCGHGVGPAEWCDCDLIARVRANEREKIAQETRLCSQCREAVLRSGSEQR